MLRFFGILLAVIQGFRGIGIKIKGDPDFFSQQTSWADARRQFGAKCAIDIACDRGYYPQGRPEVELILMNVVANLPPYIPDIRNCDDMVRIMRGRICERYGDCFNAHWYGAHTLPNGKNHACIVVRWKDSDLYHIFDHNECKLDPAGYETYKIKD